MTIWGTGVGPCEITTALGAIGLASHADSVCMGGATRGARIVGAALLGMAVAGQARAPSLGGDTAHVGIGGRVLRASATQAAADDAVTLAGAVLTSTRLDGAGAEGVSIMGTSDQLLALSGVVAPAVRLGGALSPALRVAGGIADRC